MQIQSNETSTTSNVKTVSRPHSLTRKLKKNHDKTVLNVDKLEPTPNSVGNSTSSSSVENNKNDITKPNSVRQQFKFFPFIRSDNRLHLQSGDNSISNKNMLENNSKLTEDDVFIDSEQTLGDSNILDFNLEEDVAKDLSSHFALDSPQTNVKELKNKKQIQFNIEPSSKNKTNDSDSKSSFGGSFGRRSSVHERLNQLKVEAIRKRRLNNERKESLLKEKKLQQRKKVITFNLKDLCKQIDSIQLRLYYFLQRPVGIKGSIYRLFTFTIILGSIIMGACTTIKSLSAWSFRAFFWYEVFANVYFFIELALRCWSCIHNSKYSGENGRIRFLKKPLSLIEMTVILASAILLYFYYIFKPEKDELFSPLSLLKFIHIFRFFYVDRKGQTWTLLIDVASKHRLELLTSGYIAVIVLLFSSYLILLAEKPYSEKNNDNHFHSYADALYWSIITMATIGYGDRSPRTFYGKVISTVLCIIGVVFWTLPSGIIGSGFALKVGEKNKKKQFNRLVPAAATLIQSWWRMKASLFLSSSNMSSLIATIKTFDISKPIVSQSLRRLKKAIDSGNSEEISQYFMGLDQPVKKEPNDEKLKFNGDLIHADQNQRKDFEEDLLYPVSEESNRLISNEDTLTRNDLKFVNNYLSSHSSVGHSSNEETSLMLQLSAEHLILIRTILLLKFLASKQKFKLAFKPYDFKDVIEQYTQGNMDVLLKMKDLQRKIEKVHESLPTNRNTNEIYFNPSSSARRSYVNQHQLNNHNLSCSISSFNSYGPDYQIVDNNQINCNQNITNTSANESTATRRQRHKSAQILKSTSLDFGESFEDQYNLNERVENIESKINELSNKIDKLIVIFEPKTNLEEAP